MGARQKKNLKGMSVEEPWSKYKITTRAYARENALHEVQLNLQIKTT
jgi:hypothetical protein